MSNPIVILVPGIGGNELLSYSGNWILADRVVWLSSAVLVAGGWRLLELAADGVSPAHQWFPPLTGRGMLAYYYRSCTDYLSRRGYEVRVAECDWRRTALSDGHRLANQVIALGQDVHCQIVAHSRGGLVTRYALGILNAVGRLGNVDRVIGLGVPHTGSMAAAQLLAGWDTSELLLAALIQAGRAFLPVGGSLEDLRHVITTWPSVYELLPRPGASWIGSIDVTQIYDPDWWLIHGVQVSAAWLQAARNLWTTLPAIPDGFSWIDVFSIQFSTPIGLSPSWPISTPGGMAYATLGDGTVHWMSATAPGRVRVAVPSAHGAMPQDGRVLNLIARALAGQVVADEVTGGAVLTGLPTLW